MADAAESGNRRQDRHEQDRQDKFFHQIEAGESESVGEAVGFPIWLVDANSVPYGVSSSCSGNGFQLLGDCNFSFRSRFLGRLDALGWRAAKMPRCIIGSDYQDRGN